MFVKSVVIRKMEFGLGSGQKPRKTQKTGCLAFLQRLFVTRAGNIGHGSCPGGSSTLVFLSQQQGSPGGPYLAVSCARAGPGR